MKLCFSTLACPDWKPLTIADQAASMGYNGVELRGANGAHVGPGDTRELREEVRTSFERAGVTIACVLGYTNLALAVPVKRTEQIENLKRSIDLAADLRCPLLRVFGGKPEDRDAVAAIPRVVEALRLTLPHAEARCVRLTIESHDAWCDPALLAKLLSAVNSPAVGVCWDISNSYPYADLADAYRTLSPWLCHVHIKDHRRDNNGKMRSVLPGLGELDLPRALGILRDGGYSGWISFEWEKQWEPDIEAPEIALPHFKKWIDGLLR